MHAALSMLIHAVCCCICDCVYAAKPHEPERTISSAYWSAALFIFLSHMWLCGYAYYFVVNGWRISWITVLAAVFSAWTQLLGITAGYHRLWSHKYVRPRHISHCK